MPNTLEFLKNLGLKMPRMDSDMESEVEHENGIVAPTAKMLTATIREQKSRSPAAKSDHSKEPTPGPSKPASAPAINLDGDDEGSEGDEEAESVDGDEDEEVYVVEKVMRHDIFQGGITYEIKWKGYPHSENTWEPEDNLEGARDILDAYFKKIGGHPSEITKAAPKKRGRKSTGTSTPPPKKAKGSGAAARSSRRGKRGSSASDEKIKWPDVKVTSNWMPPKPRKDAWEDILLEVQTLQVDDDGQKWAFVLWSVEDEYGKKRTSKVLLASASTAAPQALIKFYERHLVFTNSTDGN